MKTGIALGALAWIIACSEPPSSAQAQPHAAPTSAPQATAPAPVSAEAAALIETVNGADFTPGVATTTARTAARGAYDPAILRLQVLLDRAHYSPGSIDGRDGGNVRKAVNAYAADHNVEGDAAVLQSLAGADAAQVLATYTITAADARGPFVTVPREFEAQGGLRALGYENIQEALGEKFHMDPRLIAALNPGASFAASTQIVVASAGGGLGTEVASIEVNKSLGAVRALDASGRTIAFYPATIGSSEHPAPVGEYDVQAVAFNPTYHFDPSRLPTFNRPNTHAFDIAAGPNNPVGTVWIDLSLDTYGIHGTPDPEHVGKTESHGCVRLTNWDAAELAHAVHAGVHVTFVEATASNAARAG